MICFEIRNFFQRKGLLLLALFLLVLNGLLLLRASNRTDDFGNTLDQINDSYTQLPSRDDEKLAWIENQMQSARLADSQRYSVLLDRVSEAVNYQSNLADRIAEAEFKLSSGIFTTPGTFDDRSLQMVAKIYSPLAAKRITPTIESSLGIELATQNRITDAILTFFALAIPLGIVTLPKEEGAWTLLKPLKYGRGRLLAAKFGAVLVLLCAALVLAFGTNLCIAQVRFGLGALQRPIQSLYGFSTCRFAISVGQYLLLFTLYKLLWLITVGAICFFCCIYLQNSISVCVAAIGLFGIALLCLQSAEPWLKITNLIWAGDAAWYFSGYYGLNFFGYPLDALWVAAVGLTLAFTLATILSYTRFVREENVPVEKATVLRAYDVPRHTKLFLHEGYKLFVRQGAGLVLILLFGLQIWLCETKPYYMDIYMHDYAQQFQGKTDAAREAFLEEEQAKLDGVHTQLSRLDQQLRDQAIDEALYNLLAKPLTNQLAYEDAFFKTKDQHELVKAKRTEQPDIAFVEQQVYQQILGSAARQDHGINAASLAITVALGLSAVFEVEQRTQMGQLLAVSRKRKEVRRSKIALGWIFSALAALAAVLPNLVFVQKRLGFAMPNASVRSLLFLPNTIDLPIWAYMAATVGLWIFAAGIGGMVVLLFSKQSKSRATAALGSGLFLLLAVFALFVM